MRAGGINAFGIQTQVVRLYSKAKLASDFGLLLFDFRIAKLDDTITLQADQVVMVLATIEFKNGFA
jgi:hypothetical protein